MISPALQRQTAKIDANVFLLSSGHLPFLSKPKETGRNHGCSGVCARQVTIPVGDCRTSRPRVGCATPDGSRRAER
jgi:hypothetical protein